MQPTIVKTSKSELCLVVVPERSVHHIAHKNMLTYYYHDKMEVFDLTEGNWQLIGPLKDITEEQAVVLVDRTRAIITSFGGPIYLNYQNAYKDCYTALESLHSLVDSTGLKGNVIILKRTAYANM